MVYLKLKPFIQQSLPHSSHKLSRRYYGPFPVIEKVGMVAYRLQLPKGAQLHDVFHVSLLKYAHTPVEAIGSLAEDASSALHFPQAALDRKMVKKRYQAVTKWLIQWAGLTPEEATWEFADEIQARYPTFVP